MSARPGDLVAGGGYIGEAVQFTPGMVGIALLADQAGQRRRIEFVRSAEVHVLKLAADWNGGPRQTKKQRELDTQLDKLRLTAERFRAWDR